MASKLSQLRQGISPHKIVEIGDMEFAVVILASDIMLQIEQEVQEYATQNESRVNAEIRNRLFDIKLCYHCMRDPQNINKRVSESPEEVASILDPEDISRVTQAYSELMINKAPKIELLNDEEFEELKKHLEVTPLKDLSTVLLVHLTNSHQTIRSER